VFPSFPISNIFWGAWPYTPSQRSRGLQPLLSAPAGVNKRETPTSNLTESTVKSQLLRL